MFFWQTSVKILEHLQQASIYLGYIVCTTPPIVLTDCYETFMVAAQIDFIYFFCLVILAIFFFFNFTHNVPRFSDFLLKDEGLLTLCLPLANLVIC